MEDLDLALIGLEKVHKVVNDVSNPWLVLHEWNIFNSVNKREISQSLSDQTLRSSQNQVLVCF